MFVVILVASGGDKKRHLHNEQEANLPGLWLTSLRQTNYLIVHKVGDLQII